MSPEDWKPIYEKILEEFGYDRSSDENSARLLKAVMVNADLISDDDVVMRRDATVFGCGGGLEDDMKKVSPRGTLIASGASAGALERMGITPHIVVTDLDGEIGPQIDASRRGAVTFIHAHGDNSHLIQRYAKEFTGPVILTTQSRPDNLVSNYGGFTDGDRAVCIARHFGAEDILLLGFDFSTPSIKEGSDPKIKAMKLRWAEKIIFGCGRPGTSVEMPR
ncbi:MAG: DUF115 domain-containing protein [Candidatus Methanoplasma sp.]|jgi:uncharacterized Rossmann fold enzyme|nr:DUF115 domain-containing protein [Candidatus Methanoplasma sp.]